MPYCCQCGAEVGETDAFCTNCGARQGPPVHRGISARTASLLCYIPLVGWLAAIIALASARFRDNHRVRFHAFQGLYLFIAWLLVDWAVEPFFRIPGPPPLVIFRIIPELLKAAIIITGIFMMVEAGRGELFKLPIIGELAEKSISEQR